MTLARDHAPASTVPRPAAPCGPTCAVLPAPAPRLPTTAFGAPCANVGARSASAPFVAGHRRAGQLNVSGSVPRKRAPLLNALGSSLPAGQKRERERRPEPPRRALLHARGALCANAVHARVVLAERRRSRKRGGETQRPRRSLSEAAVKKCGVAFPRPRVNGSASRAIREHSPGEQPGQIRRLAPSQKAVRIANAAG